MTATIVVHSFLRDSHKSTIAAHLAAQLVAEGMRVGLVEADMLMPDLHRSLPYDVAGNAHTFTDFFLGRCGLADAAVEVGMRQGLAATGALLFVPASVDRSSIEDVLQARIEMTRLESGFVGLSTQHKLDILLVHAPAGLDEVSLSCIALADILIITLRLDEEDTHGASVTMDLAQRLNIPQVLLVVNRVDDEYEPEVVRQEVESVYGVSAPLVLTVSDESRMAFADHSSLLQRAASPLAPLIKAVKAEIAHAT